MDLLGLSVGLGAGLVTSRLATRFREDRTAPTAVADLLNWGFVIDDDSPAVVLQKDGSLLCGWQYRGPDLNAATAEEIDALSGHINDALLPFTDNWMFHVDAVRRPASTYAPADPAPRQVLCDMPAPSPAPQRATQDRVNRARSRAACHLVAAGQPTMPGLACGHTA